MTAPGNGAFRYSLEGERVIDAGSKAVWSVLADFHRVDRWAPRVTRVVAIGDTTQGIGMARHCDVRGLGGLREVVNVWEEGSALGYSVTPVGPIGAAQSLWRIEPMGSGTTRVTLNLSYDMRFGVVGAFLHAILVRRLLAGNLPGALALLKRSVESAPATTPSYAGTSPEIWSDPSPVGRGDRAPCGARRGEARGLRDE